MHGRQRSKIFRGKRRHSCPPYVASSWIPRTDFVEQRGRNRRAAKSEDVERPASAMKRTNWKKEHRLYLQNCRGRAINMAFEGRLVKASSASLPKQGREGKAPATTDWTTMLILMFVI